MPDEGKNFGGSLVLDFWKWWRHVKTIYTAVSTKVVPQKRKSVRDNADWYYG